VQRTMFFVNGAVLAPTLVSVIYLYCQFDTGVGGSLLDRCESRDDAIEVFCQLYKEKTKNDFGSPFVKVRLARPIEAHCTYMPSFQSAFI
jgi:hypothetical protein